MIHAASMQTLGWQKPYSVQHSAQPGQPSTWSTSSVGVLKEGWEEVQGRDCCKMCHLKGAAGQEPVPEPAPRQPPRAPGRRRGAWGGGGLRDCTLLYRISDRPEHTEQFEGEMEASIRPSDLPRTAIRETGQSPRLTHLRLAEHTTHCNARAHSNMFKNLFSYMKLSLRALNIKVYTALFFFSQA